MPQGFAPISRMCLRKIKTKGDQAFEFICISWHGIYKMKLEEKKHQFESMLTYILKLSKKQSLPVILAGDFNVKIRDIETLVSPPFVLYEYTPTERREPNTIDFYISSKSLVMSDIKPLTLQSETGVTEVLSLLDHDPVVALMTTKTENKDTPKTQSGEVED
jgi:endonuclease/exonuclease/phosphatase family metal-dependent hydrolase